MTPEDISSIKEKCRSIYNDFSDIRHFLDMQEQKINSLESRLKSETERRESAERALNYFKKYHEQYNTEKATEVKNGNQSILLRVQRATHIKTLAAIWRNLV